MMMISEGISWYLYLSHVCIMCETMFEVKRATKKHTYTQTDVHLLLSIAHICMNIFVTLHFISSHPIIPPIDGRTMETRNMSSLSIHIKSRWIPYSTILNAYSFPIASLWSPYSNLSSFPLKSIHQIPKSPSIPRQ